MKLNRKINLFIIIVFILFSSCEKIINIDIPEKDRKLVINGLFSPDENFFVQVSKSLNILDKDSIIMLDGATVNIYEDDVLLETLTESYMGIYYSVTSKPKIGKEYKVTVSSENHVPVEAKTTIPEKVNIISVDTSTNKVNDPFGMDTEEFKIDLKFLDPAAETNYYLLEVKQIISGKDNEPYEQNVSIYTDDPIITASLDYPSGLLFSDRIFDGKTKELQIKMGKFGYYYNPENPDTISIPEETPKQSLIVRLYSITQAYYLYLNSLQQHRNTKDNPFAEAVQVFSNVTNGYGILAAYSADFVEMEIDWNNYDPYIEKK